MERKTPIVELANISCGGFDALIDHDLSLNQSFSTPRSRPVNKTVPPAPVKACEMDWAVESDDEYEPVVLPMTLPDNVTVRTKKRDWADYENDEDW
jgi:hypothetical protein